MLTGVVSEQLEPTIHLAVRGPDGTERDAEWTIDTGFNGWISLPSAWIAQLDLPWRRRGQGVLADGSTSIFDIYEAEIIWDGRAHRVWVDEMEASPLLGMSLLNGHEMTIQAWAGGKVTIDARA